MRTVQMVSGVTALSLINSSLAGVKKALLLGVLSHTRWKSREADGKYTCTVEGYDEKVGGYRLIYDVTNPDAAIAAIHDKNAEEE